MVEIADIRRLALILPEVEVGPDAQDLKASVGGKGLCWAWLARETPKGRRLVVPGVVAIRCLIETKDMLIEAAPDRFFTDDHYRGYPAVLARYGLMDEAELRAMLTTAWRLSAPRAVLKRHPEIATVWGSAVSQP